MEDGTRTFAVTEIMIREPWRRQGHARVLHDALLSGRPEPRGALLVLPGNGPAQAAYRSWGWSRLAGLRPFEDGPVYDAMVLDTPPGPLRRRVAPWRHDLGGTGYCHMPM